MPPPPQDIHILMAGTCRYTLYGQRDFEDVIQISILRRGDVGLLGEHNARLDCLLISGLFFECVRNNLFYLKRCICSLFVTALQPVPN